MSAPAVHLTRELGTFVASFGDEVLPPPITRLIEHSVVDCLGATVAGAAEAAAQTVRSVCADNGTESSLIPGPGHAGAAAAALINGTAAHALDYDDVAVQGHISAVLMPAILAEAEARALDGRRVIAAYAVGYQVWAELIGRQKDQLHRKGWHPTGVHGPVAASAWISRYVAWARRSDNLWALCLLPFVLLLLAIDKKEDAGMPDRLYTLY